MSGPGELYLITGSQEAGKSRFLLELVAAIRREIPHLVLRGLISPAVREGGKKVAIELLDVANGARRRLAARGQIEPSGPTTEHWGFNQEALDWGNRILKEAAAEFPDLVVIDELGPLEFQRGQGFTAGLGMLDEGRYRAALVTVRPALLDIACDRWDPAGIIELKESQDHSPAFDLLRKKLLKCVSRRKGEGP